MNHDKTVTPFIPYSRSFLDAVVRDVAWAFEATPGAARNAIAELYGYDSFNEVIAAIPKGKGSHNRQEPQRTDLHIFGDPAVFEKHFGSKEPTVHETYLALDYIDIFGSPEFRNDTVKRCRAIVRELQSNEDGDGRQKPADAVSGYMRFEVSTDDRAQRGWFVYTELGTVVAACVDHLLEVVKDFVALWDLAEVHEEHPLAVWAANDFSHELHEAPPPIDDPFYVYVRFRPMLDAMQKLIPAEFNGLVLRYPDEERGVGPYKQNRLANGLYHDILARVEDAARHFPNLVADAERIQGERMLRDPWGEIDSFELPSDWESLDGVAQSMILLEILQYILDTPSSPFAGFRTAPLPIEISEELRAMTAGFRTVTAMFNARNSRLSQEAAARRDAGLPAIDGFQAILQDMDANRVDVQARELLDRLGKRGPK